MRENFLPYSPPTVGADEVEEVAKALQSGWITTGPRTAKFEEEFAAAVGAEAALGVSSGTDAMQVGLAALGIGEGDEVITSTMTFCSSAHVIEHVGARPVLVDVDEETLCINPEQVAARVSEKTRAILPVHLYGHPCDLDALEGIARRHDLVLIEDAAHSLPATYKGRAVGSIGDGTAFSFYATKNLTTAEGGMLTGSKELIAAARPWTIHGISRDAHSRYSSGGSWFYEVVLPGFKCNMTDIQAAIGLVQLKRLPELQKRRLQIVAAYNSAFGNKEEIQVPVERSEVESAWHLYVIRLKLDQITIDRDRFIQELAERQIGSSVHFIPVHLHPYYRGRYGFKPDDFPVAFSEYQRIVSLPLHPGLTDHDVQDVIDAVVDVIRKNRR